MLKIYILKGLPASGKTQWAKEQLAKNPNGIKRISKDDLRAMLDGGKWSGGAEKFILKARDALIALALREGKHVIVDDTNLALKHEARIRGLAAPDLSEGFAGAEVEIVDFTHVSVDECVERDRGRPNYVGEKVIRNMHRQFLMDWTKTKLRNGQGPTVNPDLPNAVICDIDGTLAVHNGRSPYEFEKCGEDLCNGAVKYALERSRGDGAWAIFVSGREEKYRDVTTEWLSKKLNFASFDLFMRPTDDKRHDDIVKKEIYDREIKGKYNILFVLDDRQRVVDMWRAEGLVCFQVDYGDF